MSASTFAFDVDSTLLDFVSGFVSWMALEGHHTPHDREVVLSHDTFLTDLYPHLRANEALSFLQLFNLHDSFTHLAPLPDACAAVKKSAPFILKRVASPFPQWVVTRRRSRRAFKTWPVTRSTISFR